jgi:hypothetical protein
MARHLDLSIGDLLNTLRDYRVDGKTLCFEFLHPAHLLASMHAWHQDHLLRGSPCLLQLELALAVVTALAGWLGNLPN